MLKKLPIRRKLMAIILLTSGVVAVLTSSAFFAYEFFTFRQTTVLHLATLGEIVAENTTAALAFDNADDATGILRAVKAERHIEAAALYDKDGKLFARYPSSLPPAQFPSVPKPDGYHFGQSRLAAFLPVSEGSRRIGTLYLRSDMEAMYERFRLYGGIVALVLTVTFAVAYLLSRALQKQISRPILTLTETAKAVSDHQDYAVRATKLGDDELGFLTDAFNRMLGQIQEQHAGIRELNATLERRVEDRTEALHASKRELEGVVHANHLIMEHSVDVICTIDGRGLFTFVSAACERAWGFTPAELAGTPFMALVHPEDHSKTAATISELMAGRTASDFQNRYRRKDGSVVSVVWSASWSAADNLMFCVAHDVTERNRAQETLRQTLDELSRANEELGQASKLKDEFLANMSHELRTPLNAILGLSEALLEQVSGTLTPRQVKSVTTISTSGTHLLALINDILDLSKVEAGKLELNLETVNVREFCESCLLFVRTQAMQKTIGVTFDADQGVEELSADPKRLKQILVNLLTNAVKFTAEGGRIGLSVDAPAGDSVVRFTVWDTGIGIAPDDQRKLFRSFTQIDSGLTRAQEGTGLGLALVAKLVELHSGGVTIESDPGRGSRFIVTLPQSGGTRKPSTAADSDQTDRRGYRRALIIEDDPTSGAILVNYLTKLGLASSLYPRGERVLDEVLRERPDVILLDVMLPDESGWVVLAKLKEHPSVRDIPVVVISVMDEPEKSRVLGAAAHFTKPIKRAQLAAFFQRDAGQPVRSPARAGAVPVPTGPVILLAEDNEANIQTIGGYLEDRGCAMHYAPNGLIAVKLARELRPALILMDVQMPVMDGLTAIRKIRSDAGTKMTPIVALTALAMSGDRERCIAAGADDYLSKPVSLKALAALVERLAPARAGETGGIPAPA